jgi:hypothetical protein
MPTSHTVTLKLQDAVAPPESVAVHVTFVVPNGKAVPEAGLQTTVTPGQLSVTVGLGNVTLAVTLPGTAAIASRSDGQVMTGGGLEALVVTLLELLDRSGSGVIELTLAVLLNIAPSASEQLT